MTDNHFQNKYVIESTLADRLNLTEEKQIIWRSPANIALVKYWGKYGNQLPRNASISFTLSSSYTETKVTYKKLENKGLQLDYYFNGEPNQSFERKLILYLRNLLPYFPFLDLLHLRVDSHNTFPYGAGIASSASAISALALCICDIERQEFNNTSSDYDFFRKASFIARLGSGSASRSIYGKISLWGQLNNINGSHNEIAMPINDRVHEVFHSYYDSILVVDSQPKELPSSAGHNLMNYHMYAETRFRQASDNVHKLLTALATGNETVFSQIVENEALTLHALLMSSEPGYILLHPNTLNILKILKKFKSETAANFTFTLDAGPNIHLLYPGSSRELMLPFIENELKPFCENNYWIDDQLGKGPSKMK